MLKRLRYYITDKMEMVVPVSRYMTSFTGSLAETPMLRSFTLAWSCKRRVREIKILQQFLFSLLQNGWDVPSVDVWTAQHSGGKQCLFLFPSLYPDVSVF